MIRPLIEATRPPCGLERPTRPAPTTDEAWRQLLLIIGGTDEDELPLFGRMPA
jgi:hypothetical protein